MTLSVFFQSEVISLWVCKKNSKTALVSLVLVCDTCLLCLWLLVIHASINGLVLSDSSSAKSSGHVTLLNFSSKTTSDSVPLICNNHRKLAILQLKGFKIKLYI